MGKKENGGEKDHGNLAQEKELKGGRRSRKCGMKDRQKGGRKGIRTCGKRKSKTSSPFQRLESGLTRRKLEVKERKVRRKKNRLTSPKKTSDWRKQEERRERGRSESGEE